MPAGRIERQGLEPAAPRKPLLVQATPLPVASIDQAVKLLAIETPAVVLIDQAVKLLSIEIPAVVSIVGALGLLAIAWGDMPPVVSILERTEPAAPAGPCWSR